MVFEMVMMIAPGNVKFIFDQICERNSELIRLCQFIRLIVSYSCMFDFRAAVCAVPICIPSTNLILISRS